MQNTDMFNGGFREASADEEMDLKAENVPSVESYVESRTPDANLKRSFSSFAHIISDDRNIKNDEDVCADPRDMEERGGIGLGDEERALVHPQYSFLRSRLRSLIDEQRDDHDVVRYTLNGTNVPDVREPIKDHDHYQEEAKQPAIVTPEAKHGDENKALENDEAQPTTTLVKRRLSLGSIHEQDLGSLRRLRLEQPRRQNERDWRHPARKSDREQEMLRSTRMASTLPSSPSLATRRLSSTTTSTDKASKSNVSQPWWIKSSAALSLFKITRQTRTTPSRVMILPRISSLRSDWSRCL